MTDLERLKELLDSRDVPYIMTEPWRDGIPRLVVGDTISYDIPASPKVDGYGGFFTAFAFSPDGEFMLMGAWE